MSPVTTTPSAARPAAARPSPWPRRLRQLHLYLGALFAPAILFFAFSGALQEFGLHEARPGSAARPAEWIVRLAAVHKHQTLATPPDRRARPAASRPRHGGLATEPAEAIPPVPVRTLMLRVFFAAAAAGLSVTTLIGLYLAFRFARHPRLAGMLLLLGLAAPLLLLLG